MKTTGIIAEYNPFHNGHQYHIRKAREVTGADFVAVVMSGDYTQRGAPAIYNKYVRTRAALLCGADLVLEIPVFGAVAAAPDFADCGVSLLKAAGIADFLCFGSESGELPRLKAAAEALETETPEISEALRAGLKSGLSWPQARARAFAKTAPIPETPNDILGLEYLRALKKYDSDMRPIAIARSDPGYHSHERSGSFASATAVREAVFRNDPAFVRQVTPPALLACLAEEDCPAVSPDDFSLLLNEKLLTASRAELEAVSDMPGDLAARLYKNRLSFMDVSERIAASKDRQYTYTRISRCLLNLTLGITREDSVRFKKLASSPWLRLLGFRSQAGPLLSRMKKNAAVPMIAKTADARILLSPEVYALFEKNMTASELYRLICERKTGRLMKNEFTRSPIVL